MYAECGLAIPYSYLWRHETDQELKGSLRPWGRDPIVFVLNKSGYLIDTPPRARKLGENMRRLYAS